MVHRRRLRPMSAASSVDPCRSGLRNRQGKVERKNERLRQASPRRGQQGEEGEEEERRNHELRERRPCRGGLRNRNGRVEEEQERKERRPCASVVPHGTANEERKHGRKTEEPTSRASVAPGGAGFGGVS